MDQSQFIQACTATLTLIIRHTDVLWDPRRDQENPASPHHCGWMLLEAEGFYATKPEKANRWLGYVQGVIAAKGWASLEELKRANMPEGAEFSSERV